MELYFSSSEQAVTERGDVLAALRRAGLEPLPEVEGGAWVVAFAGRGLVVTFQEQAGALSFATLDVPMAEHDLGHAAFCALVDLGWVCHEDVG